MPPDPPQRPDQPDVPDRVRDLRPEARLQVREQVELAGVVGAVARTAQRNDVERVAAPEHPRMCAASTRCSDPQTMQGRPATAARCASVAAIDVVRLSGIFRTSGVRARSGARRRSGVRFMTPPLEGLVDRTAVEARGRIGPGAAVDGGSVRSSPRALSARTRAGDPIAFARSGVRAGRS